MDILCATDDKYVPATGVMLTSLLMNNSDVRIYVFSDGELAGNSKEGLNRLCKRFGCSIDFIPVDARQIGHVPDKDWPVTTYLRLLAARYLPADLHRILYLDGDMVIDSCLDELWETDLEGYSAAVVPEYQNWVSRDNIKHILQPGDYDYFNGGMMLINLDYWREHDLASTFLQVIRDRFDDIVYVDQDVMNMALKGTVRLMPVKYNFQICYAFSEFWDMYSCDIQEQVLQKPVIIHFTVIKPWVITSFGLPLRDVWRRYNDASMWKMKEQWPKEKLLKRLVLRYLIYPSGIMERYGIIDRYAYRFPTFKA